MTHSHIVPHRTTATQRKPTSLSTGRLYSDTECARAILEYRHAATTKHHTCAFVTGPDSSIILISTRAPQVSEAWIVLPARKPTPDFDLRCVVNAGNVLERLFAKTARLECAAGRWIIHSHRMTALAYRKRTRDSLSIAYVCTPAMRYYQREAWNVGFELSPCSAPGKCTLMRKQPNAWYVYADAASDVSGLSPSSRGGVSLAVHVSGELCVLWSLGVLNELRSHYGNTLGYHWCGVMCVGPRTLRVM